MIFVNIKNLINKLVLFIYNKSKRYLITAGVFVKLEPTLNVKYTDIIIMQCTHQEAVHDNDLDFIKNKLEKVVVKGINDMTKNQIVITYNNDENGLDNNFLLIATAKLKILKTNS